MKPNEEKWEASLNIDVRFKDLTPEQRERVLQEIKFQRKQVRIEERMEDKTSEEHIKWLRHAGLHSIANLLERATKNKL